jgi:hypothetical protein
LYDLKRLDDLDGNYEEAGDTTVFKFTADRHSGDSILISRMVYSNLVESRYALPGNANDILIVRNNNYVNNARVVLFREVNDKVLSSSGDYLVFEGALTDKQKHEAIVDTPPREGYMLLPKSYCYLLPHIDSHNRKWEQEE